jgi:NAD(P)-dependent dehydrogenase (short-subunit alcohol dehydrogenase family)
MAPSPICLILGGGANIGNAIARRFAGIGYQIAVVSRSAADPPAKNPDGYLNIKADLGDKEAYTGIYSKVKASLGGTPSVVIFNAASVHFPADAENLFSVPTEQLQQDLDVSVYGSYLAAGEAYKLWSEQNDGGKKTFIYTGNCLTKVILPVPALVTLGMAKNASGYWLGLADKSYKEKGFR